MWLVIIFAIVYFFKLHSKIFNFVLTLPELFQNLSPKFYVALTGTSSFLSGLILVFEWWYFKKNGQSFIEQMSLNHLGPLISPDPHDPMGACDKPGFECKVWQNPMNLLRGAEYERYYTATKKKALTFYDLNLSAQDHQTFFTCDSDKDRQADNIMTGAWRERYVNARIESAKSALQIEPDNPSALILLGEEEAATVAEAEAIFQRALVAAEARHKKTLAIYNQSNGRNCENELKRDHTVLIYVKRRLAMCWRKLGRVKEAAKVFKELTKEPPNVNWLNASLGENLIECYLELGDYANAQATLARYDDINLPKSATICYTAALLKARLVSQNFSAEVAGRRGPTSQEFHAMDAIHRAVEFNPHVPKYLLEQKSLILPPEHILKRGDSEAVAYAFHHLQHWKRIDGALNLLHSTWEGTFKMIPYPLEKGHLFYPYPQSTEVHDRDLLPPFHSISVYPKKDLPFFIIFTAVLFSITAALALFTHLYPDLVKSSVHELMRMIGTPFMWFTEKMLELGGMLKFLHGFIW